MKMFSSLTKQSKGNMMNSAKNNSSGIFKCEAEYSPVALKKFCEIRIEKIKIQYSTKSIFK